ncbi:hypothetical protein FIV42_16610 [Persicimonas caeni]|uniref:ChrR-like cupin domain-containing protein n=1 Tax=Persicimonas caeni TaxID=2292766 RepID=A0A4Y6PVN2_PERCE|nr:dimethylsulfonioproprionate lyase family protein [Persicimonas caeni]QDG52300.1 hypothetical protein FIV42_16610 [Persicimonas caeni]QED33522.1 hypothetical protein FRD00_16605 [Persicimonas caeni]
MTEHLDKTGHIDSMLDDWLAGALDEAEEAALEAHAAQCTRCARALERARQHFVELAAALDPVEPSAGLRDDLLAAATPEARFADLADEVAEIIDLSTERALRLLGRVDEASHWEEGPFPGLELFHIDGGPSVDEAIVGFVRMTPGMAFPHHSHRGAETTLVLQGGLRDADGTVYRRGEVVEHGSGTSHAFAALDDAPALIYLVVAHHGIDVGDTHFGPNDPAL